MTRKMPWCGEVRCGAEYTEKPIFLDKILSKYFEIFMQFPVFTFQFLFLYYIEDKIWRNKHSVTDITDRQLVFIYIDIQLYEVGLLF